MTAPARPSAPGAGTLTARVRFNPQVLVLLVGLVPFFYCVREAIGSGIYAWFRDTYRTTTFVAEEARPNEGFPYAAGHLEPGGEPRNEPLAPRGDGWVFESAPGVRFVPGVRLPMWWSEQAPMVGYGRSRFTNGMLVARFPALPGWPACAGWSLGALAAAYATLRCMAWTGGTRGKLLRVPIELPGGEG